MTKRLCLRFVCCVQRLEIMVSRCQYILSFTFMCAKSGGQMVSALDLNGTILVWALAEDTLLSQLACEQALQSRMERKESGNRKEGERDKAGGGGHVSFSLKPFSACFACQSFWLLAQPHLGARSQAISQCTSVQNLGGSMQVNRY